MKQIRKKYPLFFHIFILTCLILTGCSCGDNPSSIMPMETLDPTVQGTRDNASTVLVPVASGVTVHTCDSAIVDTSNAAEGYIMASYTGSNEKVKLQIKGPDGVTYTYNLHGSDYEVFPLTAGNGSYSIGVYENISGTKYSTALSATIDVHITNTFGPYLYPNQYVNFTAASPP